MPRPAARSHRNRALLLWGQVLAEHLAMQVHARCEWQPCARLMSPCLRMLDDRQVIAPWRCLGGQLTLRILASRCVAAKLGQQAQTAGLLQAWAGHTGFRGGLRQAVEAAEHGRPANYCAAQPAACPGPGWPLHERHDASVPAVGIAKQTAPVEHEAQSLRSHFFRATCKHSVQPAMSVNETGTLSDT